MTDIKKKKPLKKRILQWTLIAFLSIVMLLVATPFLFKDKIIKMVVAGINENINATLTYKDTDISLFANFPKLSVIIDDIAIINKKPFEGDTLFAAEKLNATLKITTLFQKENEPLELQSIATKNGQINILFNKDNLGNFDIALKKDDENAQENNSFSLDINAYQLENMRFTYFDQNSKNKVILDSIYHTGKGNFAKEIFNLDTKSNANISLFLNNVNFIDQVKIALDAILEMDIKNSKYTFKKNKGFINQLALEFDGFIQLFDEHQLYDITFKTPTSDFKNFLALLPKQYAGNLKNIQTKGNFDVKGILKGSLSETTIPGFNIAIASQNAMFKYAELPKSVEKIHIDANIINTTGDLKDTYVNLQKLTFKIDEDVFAANGNFSNITTNPIVNLTAKGSINLATINKVYPAPFKKKLAGILTADIVTKFDMDAIDKGNYERIQNSGKILVRNFKYEGEEVAKPFYIDKTSITFNTKSIQLNEFDAKTGTSDIAINGTLDNFYGFLLKNQELKGNFNMQSNNFIVADFLTKSPTNETTKQTSALKIPAFLDCKIVANAKNVTYDNLQMSNVSGTLLVKDETVNLQNLTSDIFGGKIGFNGNVSTKGNTSKFAMDLNLQQLNIASSFSNIDMLKSIAPIAKTIEGKINSTIRVAGNLNDDMTPNLKTITGDLFGKLLNPKLNASNSNALSLLGDKMSFLDVSKLNLDGINAFLSFENGQVTVKPIPIKYNDIAIEIGGKHSFDTTMNYDIIFDVPVKYLGPEVTNLMSKLSSKDADQLKSVPVKATLGGSFKSPSFTSNLKQSTTNLMASIVEKQKQQLIDKGKDKLTNLLGVTTKDKDTTSTTKTTTKDVVTDKVKGALTNLFNKKKDTTKKKN